MDERLAQIAALANESAYDAEHTASYIDSAPHLKHESLRNLFAQLLLRVYDAAAEDASPPRVLDLGAGEGSVTLQFLELGAHVVAVDISASQLETMAKKCQSHSDRLEIRCQDINDTLNETSEQFDIITANSFLHHIPDYMSLIANCVKKLSSRGIFFSFQDPLRYDTVKFPSHCFTETGYFLWRLKAGPLKEVVRGIGRRLRRRKGIYLDDSVEDNTEYHVVRNGVDQLAIETYFRENGFEFELVKYYSSHVSLFQRVGASIGLKNYFAVIARRAGVSPGRSTRSNTVRKSHPAQTS